MTPAHMTSTEWIGLIAGAIVIPWLVFVTKAILAVRTKQGEMHQDIKWIRREHEPEQGVQNWKNPGLVDALEKLSGLITDLKEWLISHKVTR